jgi:hypothetical protein
MAAPPPPCPDDLLASLLADYLEHLDTGQPPDLDGLRARHPHLAGEVDAFVAAAQHIDRLARPLQDVLRSTDDFPSVQQGDTEAPSAAGASSAACSLAPPARLGDYELLQEAGRGSMGVVYQARQPGLDRLVAIKVIRSADLATPERVQRFVAEARSLARLQHPNIVHVYEVGTQDNLPFFVLEYIAGGSLDRRAQRQPQPIGDAIKLVEVLARAAQHAHERGIIHRDLKPANVLLAPSVPGDAGHTPYGLPKLTDFGLARSGDHLQTTDGLVMGTPSYMAPEQAMGDSARVGPATDVHALGAILYELLTGRPPFLGESVQATLEQVRNRPAAPPRLLRPDLPPEVEGIVLRCLAKEPGQRYASAAALANDLCRVLELGPQPLHPPALPPRRRWGRRAVAVALAALAVGLLVGLAVVCWPRRGGYEPPVPKGLQGGLHVGVGEKLREAGALAEAAPLKGVLDVRVWEKGNPVRRGLRLHQEGALPLRPGDLMRVEVEMNRPAYLYVVWLGADGTVAPLYPWRQLRWDDLPAPQKQQRLYLPEDVEKDAAPLAAGPSGVETLVLLARDAPLPAGADVAGLFRGLRQLGKQRTEVRAAWFENGRLVLGENDDRARLELHRAVPLDDPVLRLQQVLGRQVPRLFSYSRAVSFEFRGR